MRWGGGNRGGIGGGKGEGGGGGTGKGAEVGLRIVQALFKKKRTAQRCSTHFNVFCGSTIAELSIIIYGRYIKKGSIGSFVAGKSFTIIYRKCPTIAS
jgi:hypothetical protein